MIFLKHDYFYNFTGASETKDWEAMISMMSADIADLIVLRTDTVLKDLKQSGVKTPKSVTVKAVYELFFESLSKNDTFRKLVAFRLAEINKITTNEDRKTDPNAGKTEDKKTKSSKDKKQEDQPKQKQLSWYEKVNQIKRSVDDFYSGSKDIPTYERILKDETWTLVKTKYADLKEIKYALEPTPSYIRYTKALIVLGIVGFALYKLYQYLPSEEEKMMMEMGGNAQPVDPNNPNINTNQATPTPEPTPPTPPPPINQDPYAKFDYSGGQ